MEPPAFSLSPSRSVGRPRLITLTEEQSLEFCQLVVKANKDRKSGSASMAWRVLCQNHPDIPWDWRKLASKHQLPAVARELASRAQAVVAFHRQGQRGLSSTGAYTPGMLRRDPLGTRRAYGGERASWDDATVNFGVVIPWPWGGCKLSERFGVKLGRFQLLVCHDEATSFVPAWSHVIRESQAYRGTDVAEAIMRVSRDVCLFDHLVLEGGVWQGARMKRVMQGLGVGLISAKGRPQCKLVENFFNRLWTRLGMEPGLSSVGRFRGEEKATSELYVKCRAGQADPRGRFPTLAEAVEGMERSIRFLNADRIESKVYGKWIPEERWASDLAEHPRSTIEDSKLWLAAPVMAKRKVTRQGVSVTATGPMGLKMRYQFTGPCLWDMEGRDVELYFDPLAEWPLTATAAKPGTAVVLGRLECSNPYHEGGIGADAAKAMREIVRREYRVLWSKGRALDASQGESEIRTPGGVATTDLNRSGPDQSAASGERGLATDATRDPRRNSGGSSDTTQRSLTGGDLTVERVPPAPDQGLRSLSRKAAAARTQIPNW